MILRIDRLQTELPPPSDPDPNGASAVQELLGGKFGEMSTLPRSTGTSSSWRRRSTRCSRARRAAAGTVGPPSAPLEGVKDARYHYHYLAGGKGALPADSHGAPWNGTYVHSSGDLIEDLTHNYFLETGARSGKLRVYEMCDHPAARALTGYLLVRGGVHQVAYARALENLTGADLTKLFPSPRIPIAKIPECQPHLERGEHLKLYRFSPNDYREIVAVFNGVHPETGEALVVIDEAPEGFPPIDLPAQTDVFAPDYAPEEISEIAKKLRKAAGVA
jgi:Mn-containing catalase